MKDKFALQRASRSGVERRQLMATAAVAGDDGASVFLPALVSGGERPADDADGAARQPSRRLLRIR